MHFRCRRQRVETPFRFSVVKACDFAVDATTPNHWSLVCNARLSSRALLICVPTNNTFTPRISQETECYPWGAEHTRHGCRPDGHSSITSIINHLPKTDSWNMHITPPCLVHQRVACAVETILSSTYTPMLGLSRSRESHWSTLGEGVNTLVTRNSSAENLNFLTQIRSEEAPNLTELFANVVTVPLSHNPLPRGRLLLAKSFSLSVPTSAISIIDEAVFRTPVISLISYCDNCPFAAGVREEVVLSKSVMCFAHLDLLPTGTVYGLNGSLTTTDGSIMLSSIHSNASLKEVISFKINSVMFGTVARAIGAMRRRAARMSSAKERPKCLRVFRRLKGPAVGSSRTTFASATKFLRSDLKVSTPHCCEDLASISYATSTAKLTRGFPALVHGTYVWSKDPSSKDFQFKNLAVVCEEVRVDTADWYRNDICQSLERKDTVTLRRSLERVGAVCGEAEDDSALWNTLAQFCHLLAQCEPCVLSFPSVHSLSRFAAFLTRLFPSSLLRISLFHIDLACCSPLLDISVIEQVEEGTKIERPSAYVHVVLGDVDVTELSGIVVLLSDPLVFKVRHRASVRVCVSDMRRPSRPTDFDAGENGRRQYDLFWRIGEATVQAKEDNAVTSVAQKAISLAFDDSCRQVSSDCRRLVGLLGNYPLLSVPIPARLRSAAFQMSSDMLRHERPTTDFQAFMADISKLVDSVFSADNCQSEVMAAVDSLAVSAESLQYLVLLALEGALGGPGVRFDGSTLILSSRQCLVTAAADEVDAHEASGRVYPCRLTLSTKPWQFLVHNLARSPTQGLREQSFRECLTSFHTQNQRLPSLILYVNSARHPLEAFHSLLVSVISRFGRLQFSSSSAGVHYFQVAESRCELALACLSTAADATLTSCLISRFGELVVCWESYYGCQEALSTKLVSSLEDVLNRSQQCHAVWVLPHPNFPN